ncbi:Diadenosine hexaphosphate hydrolase [Methyloligella halotolerans]|uniref:Diadenosine hexaphosphate hydrolase n=1 Tax=Methyloligella halotolerans TaxID=1177755 RepID=A0A1E2RXW8_9HYPH|nr:NUDIX domain-containing protein [Methyloligella halotolerans]ODA66990.1 Diadenosine hexaphosphate hydrolase [Methyloligella halotolerans]
MLAVLRRYWRVQRGMTLGAQGVVIDADDRVLLIKHTYRPGWCFPGGGVEAGESFKDALTREVHEEVGVTLTGPVTLHGIFTNFAAVKRDHIAVFLVRDWTRDGEYHRPREIAESGFFALDALPADIDGGTANRLREIFDGAPVMASWT